MPTDSLLPALSALFEPQAGGGGSFGGGGGGGGGFSGGGGGGGGGDGAGMLVYFFIRLVFEYPLVGVPLLVVVIVVLAKGSKAGWGKHQERTIARTQLARRGRASRSAAELLRASDPDFDEARFLARVEVAFDKAQRSWCAQDLGPLRPFVSDGVFERFSLQLEEQREDGWRQGMEELSAGPLSIALVDPGKHFDSITVRIPFRARIDRRGLESGEAIAGSRLPREHFVECWTFVRRRGAKTLAGNGLIEGQCPNCGAPLSMNQSARCASCECLARSGQYDWVLTEITQESVWQPESEAEVLGLAAYIAERDPGMSVPLLEDRASVAFWRRCAADRADRVDPLLRVCTPELAERYAAELAAAPERPRAYVGDCAVGSVRTLGVLAGEERDRAVVEIVWDGRRARVGERGKRVLDEHRLLHRTLFVFARKAGERTSLDEAFTTACCRTCGAPDLGGTDPVCPYCEAPRTGGPSAWLLDDLPERGTGAAAAVEQELAALARGVAAPPAARPSAAGLVWWAALVVQQDGEVDPRERAALDSLAGRLGLGEGEVDVLLRSGRSGTVPPKPRDSREARAWLRALVELALADGSIDRTERRFLESAARRLGSSRRELAGVVRDVRGELYRESRAARRQ